MSKIAELAAYLGLTNDEASRISNKELYALLDEYEEYLLKQEDLEREIDLPDFSRLNYIRLNIKGEKL